MSVFFRWKLPIDKDIFLIYNKYQTDTKEQTGDEMNEQQLRELASKNVPELDTNRTNKAIHLVMIDHLTMLPSGNVQVESENEQGHFYQVNPVRMSCNCKDFERRHMTCKHLAAYLIWKSIPRQAEPKRTLTHAERMTNFENYLKSLNLNKTEA